MTITERYFTEMKGCRGQLETEFITPTSLDIGYVPMYLKSGPIERPVLPVEDLSYMNPKSSKLSQQRIRESWKKLTPEQRVEWVKARQKPGQKHLYRQPRNGQKK